MRLLIEICIFCIFHLLTTQAQENQLCAVLQKFCKTSPKKNPAPVKAAPNPVPVPVSIPTPNEGTKTELVPERLSKLYVLLNQTVDRDTNWKADESFVGPNSQTNRHFTILEIIFKLLKTRCAPVNQEFSHGLRDLSQNIVNLVALEKPHIFKEEKNGKSINPGKSGKKGKSTGKSEAKKKGGRDSNVDDTNYDYGSSRYVQGRRVKRAPTVDWSSILETLNLCSRIVPELEYQANSKGVPVTYSHWSLKTKKVPILSTKTIFEQVLRFNPIVEGLWQVFLFSYSACNEHFRNEIGGVEDFIEAFYQSFVPIMDEYWLDEEDYSTMYKELFHQMDYETEIDKIRACVWTYQYRNPDLTVPRRPFKNVILPKSITKS